MNICPKIIDKLTKLKKIIIMSLYRGKYEWKKIFVNESFNNYNCNQLLNTVIFDF